MSGNKKIFNPVINAKLLEGYNRKKGERLEFIRVSVELREDGFYARPFGKQGSNILTGMLFAHGFGVVDVGVKELKQGDIIKVILIDTSFMEGSES